MELKDSMEDARLVSKFRELMNPVEGFMEFGLLDWSREKTPN